jgi:hypothetical protein
MARERKGKWIGSGTWEDWPTSGIPLAVIDLPLPWSRADENRKRLLPYIEKAVEERAK